MRHLLERANSLMDAITNESMLGPEEWEGEKSPFERLGIPEGDFSLANRRLQAIFDEIAQQEGMPYPPDAGRVVSQSMREGPDAIDDHGYYIARMWTQRFNAWWSELHAKYVKPKPEPGPVGPALEELPPEEEEPF